MFSFRMLALRKKIGYKLLGLSLLLIFMYWVIPRSTNTEPSNPIIVEENFAHKPLELNQPIVAKPDLESVPDIPPMQEPLNVIETKNEEIPIFDPKLILKPIQREDGIMSVTPGLGENGVAVHLGPVEQKEADKVFKEAAFNVYLSNRIALNRTIPDSRNSMCKTLKYDKDLPTASIVIIFTNEVWSALLRTIYSVINRTPSRFLKEIILVDDFSDRAELKERLENYLQQNFKNGFVQIIRMPKRRGLIRARLEGAKVASGDVLVFLDSHCETNDQWIEPLLQRIKEKRTAVLCPIIDVIDDNTFEYFSSNGDYFQIGGFTWNGHFSWIEIPGWKDNENHIMPTRSPTMAGGLFAIDRQYFWEIGSYDEGMDIWGGENLEMSFRVWMCGGSLEIIPCSHVGHIFRSYHPYTFPGNKDTHGINTVRTVEVWMDSYKQYFYTYRPDLRSIPYGDISNRLKLREKLKCQSFEWYLKNIYPQKFIFDHDVDAYGAVRNPKTDLCLDTLNHNEESTSDLGLYSCQKAHILSTNQLFSLTKGGLIRREETCLEASSTQNIQEVVTLSKCSKNDPKQIWRHKKGGPIFHQNSGRCLDVARSQANKEVYVMPCRGFFTQLWWFDHYTDIKIDIQFDTL